MTGPARDGGPFSGFHIRVPQAPALPRNPWFTGHAGVDFTNWLSPLLGHVQQVATKVRNDAIGGLISSGFGQRPAPGPVVYFPTQSQAGGQYASQWANDGASGYGWANPGNATPGDMYGGGSSGPAAPGAPVVVPGAPLPPPNATPAYLGGGPQGAPAGQSVSQWLNTPATDTYELSQQELYLLQHPSAVSQAGPWFQQRAQQNELAESAIQLVGTVIGGTATPTNVAGGYYPGYTPAQLQLLKAAINNPAAVTTTGLGGQGGSSFYGAFNPAVVQAINQYAASGWSPVKGSTAVDPTNGQVYFNNSPAPYSSGAVAQPGGGGAPAPIPAGSPVVDPHGGITQADIATVQKYIAQLSAVPHPTASQLNELATYQARLADYTRRYNGG